MINMLAVIINMLIIGLVTAYVRRPARVRDLLDLADRGILDTPGLTDVDRRWLREMWVGPPELVAHAPGGPGVPEVPAERPEPASGPTGRPRWHVRAPRGRRGAPVAGDQADPTLTPGTYVHPVDQTLTLPEL
jgi:hypothetical protein